MNQQCYLCNEKSTEWRTNFVKLHSKYTKTLYRDIFKRFLSEYSTQRNLDDASNQICLQCVTKIDDYDLILSTAAKKEIDLRNLLINTEQMFNCHSIKNDTAIPSPNDSLDDQRIHTKKLKSYKSKEKIIQSLKSNEYGIHKKNLAASSKNSSKVLTYNNVKNTPVKVMKPVTNIKILNSSTQQLKSLNNNLMVSNKLQSHDAKLQLIRTTYEKHMGKSKQDNPIAVSLRAPVEFRTKCLECNDNVWYNCYDYQTHLHQTHLTCYLCNLTFTELKRSKRHMEWHNTTAGLICRICHHQLSNKASYEEHLNLHKKAKMYECVICGQANKNSNRLKSHVNTHDGIDCSFCGKHFKRKDECLFHEKRHREYPASFQRLSFMA